MGFICPRKLKKKETLHATMEREVHSFTGTKKGSLSWLMQETVTPKERHDAIIGRS